jgi:secreted trypsin-like serine protease
VVAVGWGRLSEGGLAPSTLQQVTLRTVDYRASTCESSINDKTKQFCAGVSGGGKGHYFQLLLLLFFNGYLFLDTCQGDSGGPLMMFSPNNQWVLVGLTSFGEGCARPDFSGVYTRVAVYDSWIRSNTNGSYWSVALSNANNRQTSVYYLFFFVLHQFYC